jgi:hypothetical protein
MVVSYVIGAILIAFGLAVIYESYSGTLTTIRIYYYPAIGTVFKSLGQESVMQAICRINLKIPYETLTLCL